MTAPVTLPTEATLEEIERVIGSAVMAVEEFESTIVELEGPAQQVDLDEAARMLRDGIPFPDPPPLEYNPEAFVRLLMFFEDALTDAESLRTYLTDLKERSIAVYHEQVRWTREKAARDA